MLTPDVALSFFGIAVLLALSPGPDNLFVLTQSMLWGRAAGLWVVLGLCPSRSGARAADVSIRRSLRSRATRRATGTGLVLLDGRQEPGLGLLDERLAADRTTRTTRG